MSHDALIKEFYTAFSKGNYKGMIYCYHEDIIFKDPAFGELHGDRAKTMWNMLLSNKTAAPEVSFSNVKVINETGSANWTAVYFYGPKKRKVINHVKANFLFKDGKIIKHTDNFNVWKWSSQALGPIGYLMGWSPFIKKKIKIIANTKLDNFVKNKS